MFTHQTPGPRNQLGPRGVSAHLRGQATPRQQPLRTEDRAPHTPSPNSSAQPLPKEPRSRGGGSRAVGRNAEAMARLLRASMPPLWPLPNSGSVSDSAPCARSVSLLLALGKWRRRRRRPRRRRRRPRRRRVHGARPPRSAGAGGRGRSRPPPFCLWAAARRLPSPLRRADNAPEAVEGPNLRPFFLFLFLFFPPQHKPLNKSPKVWGGRLGSEVSAFGGKGRRLVLYRSSPVWIEASLGMAISRRTEVSRARGRPTLLSHSPLQVRRPFPPSSSLRSGRPRPRPVLGWPPARGEPGWAVTRRPLGAGGRLQCAGSGLRIKAGLVRPAPSRWRTEKRKMPGGSSSRTKKQ
ncbi:uncharacterized protein RHO17_009136 isoform 1-T6 [Thomomys bottae]